MVDKRYDSVQANVTEKVGTFLAGLAQQRDVVMTHTSGGKLLYTSIDSSQKEIGVLDMGYPVNKASLFVDTETLSSEVVVLKESPKKRNPSPDYHIEKNPYSPSWTWKYSPKTIVMDSDDESGLIHAAKAEIRSQILDSVRLSMSLASWFINDTYVEPNKLVVFSSEELGLYTPQKWFIQEVDYMINSKEMTCNIELVRPECYTRGEFVNIFE
jgi:prophage tail gpP-like protein